jgi:FkbM family methyltransferase
MLKINYPNISYDFPKYYACDVEWYTWSEMETKNFFLQAIRTDDVIIDAGAQIGMYSVFFSKLAPNGKVFAFEPTDTINLLNENIKYHSCDNVSTHNVALSNKNGVHVDTIYKIWSQQLTEKKEFNFTTIDSFVLEKNIKPNLIKIDVDSYDFEVLQGSKETLIKHEPSIVVELNDGLGIRGASPKMAIDFMKSINYSVRNVFNNQNYLFMKDRIK